jgi:UDP-N-acetylmuramate dehydrogenase
VPLAPLTTLRLGGPARTLLPVTREDDLAAAVRDLDARGEPPLILAGGSNVVVADDGFPGTVVHVRTRGVEREDLGEDRVRLVAQAGEPWEDLVAAAVGDGLAGIECLAGIPGSTGATPIQNVGAYGQEVAGTIAWVRALDRASGEVVVLEPEACDFGYRSSRFKRDGAHAVLAVAFDLRRSADAEPLRYAELATALGADVGDRVPLARVREAVLALRRAKGMVLDPADHDTWSAGSFFTNPIVDADAFEAFHRRAQAIAGAEARIPAYAEPGGRVKLSAAWLIEHAGFRRGDGEGPVRLSAKHALALTNRGGATTAELLAFAHRVAAGVEERFGIALQPEPVLVGETW